MKRVKKLAAVLTVLVVLTTGRVGVMAQNSLITGGTSEYGGYAGYLITDASTMTETVKTSVQFNTDNAQVYVSLQLYKDGVYTVYPHTYSSKGAKDISKNYSLSFTKGNTFTSFHGVTGGTKYDGFSKRNVMTVS